MCVARCFRRFLPNTFTDNDFGALQCVFALFRFMLLYHDPELCNFLDQNDMGPEVCLSCYPPLCCCWPSHLLRDARSLQLYASSWFITLYANRLRAVSPFNGMLSDADSVIMLSAAVVVDQDTLLYFWDLLLLESEEDPLLHYFVSLALLSSQRYEIGFRLSRQARYRQLRLHLAPSRKKLMAESVVTLPEALSKLTINTKKVPELFIQPACNLTARSGSLFCAGCVASGSARQDQVSRSVVAHAAAAGNRLNHCDVMDWP